MAHSKLALSDVELTKMLHTCYLSAAIPADNPLPIHNKDAYADDPDQLTQQHASVVTEDGKVAWLFIFCLNRHGSRVQRTVKSGAGTWHRDRKGKDVVTREAGKIGQRKSFAFTKKGAGGKKARTGWLMQEYQLEDGNPLVLCKIYAKPNGSGTTSNEVVPTAATVEAVMEVPAVPEIMMEEPAAPEDVMDMPIDLLVAELFPAGY